ncbi:MAG: MATE family efflux transporter [Victivallales bacterium]|nr:MATE family efflux transporter [Victivallales bacterium]
MMKDMTTGSPLKQIFFFLIPILLGNMLQQVFHLVDVMIVGRTLGEQKLAAVGATISLAWTALGFFWGMTSGFTTITSQRFGAKDESGVRRSFTNSILICLVLSILFTVGFWLFTPQFLILTKVPEELLADATTYLRIIYLGIGTTVSCNLLTGVIRALGNSRTPLYILCVSSVVNVIFDLVFICVFHWDVAGAAWATVISQVAVSLCCVVYICRKMPILHPRREDWNPNWKMSATLTKQGLPMALNFTIMNIGGLLLQSAVNQFGGNSMATVTIAGRLNILMVQPMIAYGQAMVTYVAQNFGANKYKRILTGMWQSGLMLFAWNLCAALILLTCGQYLVGLFLKEPNPEIIDYSMKFFLIASIFYPVLSSLFVFRSCLQGVGMAFVVMFAGMGELVMRAICSIVLPKYIGFWGICFANPMAWLGSVLVLFFPFLYWRYKNRDRFLS